nr:hypothetical protein [uncultured Flavobacterium sp.]
MNDLEVYNRNQKLNKITFFIKENLEEVKIEKIFFLKTINETENGKTLLKLKKIIDNDNLFKLVLFKNNSPYNFNRLDSEGIVGAVEAYYELYLVVDKQDNFYICVIQENNFFKDKPINELIYFKKVKKNNYWLYFLNRTKLYP